MGKGADSCTHSGATMMLGDLPSTELPLHWNSEKLNIEYVDNPEALQQCLQALRHPEVVRVGLDIETTGGLKPWHGTTRLIQIGVELPEPKQFLIDCWAIDPAPAFSILEDPRVEVVTHNGEYEQKHLYYRYGIVLTNQWDTCYASRAIWKTKAEPGRDRQKQAIYQAEAPHRKTLRELRAALRACSDPAESLALQRKIDAAELARKRAREEARRKTPGPRTVRHTFKALMRRYLDKQISKEQQTSAWDDPVLSRAQRRYAAMDVAGLLDVRRAIGAEVSERGLDVRVDQANREILDRCLEELAGGDLAEAEYSRLARAMANASTLAQLERFYLLQGQSTLHFTFRQKIEQLYTRRRAELGG